MAQNEREIGERVVQAVATTRGVDPMALPPLYDAVDPDALDALVTGMDDGEVRFGYAGRTVTVTATGVIDVEGERAGARRSRTVRMSN